LDFQIHRISLIIQVKKAGESDGAGGTKANGTSLFIACLIFGWMAANLYLHTLGRACVHSYRIRA
jgi:hypothetical protein